MLEYLINTSIMTKPFISILLEQFLQQINNGIGQTKILRNWHWNIQYIVFGLFLIGIRLIERRDATK